MRIPKQTKPVLRQYSTVKENAGVTAQKRKNCCWWIPFSLSHYIGCCVKYGKNAKCCNIWSSAEPGQLCQRSPTSLRSRGSEPLAEIETMKKTFLYSFVGFFPVLLLSCGVFTKNLNSNYTTNSGTRSDATAQKTEIVKGKDLKGAQFNAVDEQGRKLNF